MKKFYAALVAGALVAAAHSATASVIITEVDPFGSNGSDGYSEDWFELTSVQRRERATGKLGVEISPQLADFEVTQHVFEKLIEEDAIDLGLDDRIEA